MPLTLPISPTPISPAATLAYARAYNLGLAVAKAKVELAQLASALSDLPRQRDNGQCIAITHAVVQPSFTLLESHLQELADLLAGAPPSP